MASKSKTKKKYGFDTDFQKKILATVLQDPVYLEEHADVLKPVYFTNTSHEIIARVVLKLHSKLHVRPSRVVLTEALLEHARQSKLDTEDTDQLTSDLDDLYEEDLRDAAYVKEKTTQFGQHQALKDGVVKVIDLMEKADLEPDKYSIDGAYPILQKAITAGHGVQIGGNLLDELDHMDKIREQDRTGAKKYRVRLGFKSTDSAFQGGPGAGELLVALGESGLGKSHFLVNCAAMALRQGKRVVYFTLELAAVDVKLRVASRLCSTPIHEVEKKTERFKTAREMVKRLPGNAALYTVYLKPSERTVLTMRAALAKIEAQHGHQPDLIIVDYLGEMHGLEAEVKDSSYFVMGQIAADLIEMGVDYTCPVFSANQITRDSYGQDPGLQNCGLSMRVVDLATYVVALCQGDREESKGKMRLCWLKTRRKKDKRKLVTRCNIDFSMSMFKEVKDNLKVDGDEEEAVARKEKRVEAASKKKTKKKKRKGPRALRTSLDQAEVGA
jgi:replicative DNA helicase